jgi:membrane fusion protein (multidrug efflux system)
LIEARTQLLLAQASLAADKTALTVAQTRLADTVIRAPIAGYVEDPRVRVGALLEFNSGDPPLFHILNLDPVRLAYDVPYSERLRQIARTGATDAQDLLSSVRLRIATTEGQVLKNGIIPHATAVQVDPEMETIRVLATVDNADQVLRPGMDVRVFSDAGAIDAASQ